MPQRYCCNKTPEECLFAIAHEIGHKVVSKTFAKDYCNKHFSQLSYFAVNGAVSGASAIAMCQASSMLMESSTLDNWIPLSLTQHVIAYSIISLGCIILNKYCIDKTTAQQASHFTELFCDTFATLVTKDMDAGIRFFQSANSVLSQIDGIITISSHPSIGQRIKNIQNLKKHVETRGYPIDPIAFAYKWTLQQFTRLRPA